MIDQKKPEIVSDEDLDHVQGADGGGSAGKAVMRDLSVTGKIVSGQGTKENKNIWVCDTMESQ
ncbi:MAG: hypothetical protein AAGH68_02070 [Pseudomonadota bacterium]